LVVLKLLTLSYQLRILLKHYLQNTKISLIPLIEINYELMEPLKLVLHNVLIHLRRIKSLITKYNVVFVITVLKHDYLLRDVNHLSLVTSFILLL